MPQLEIAYKFVNWDVPELETLKNTTPYKIKLKIINGKPLNRDDKNFIAKNNGVVRLHGYVFYFYKVCKTYIVKQWESWQEYQAPDKTSLRKAIYGRIQFIQELTK